MSAKQAIQKEKVIKKPRAKPTTKVNKKDELAADVYDIKGERVGSISLPKQVFQVKASDKLLAQYIRVYHANQRQGNVSVKTRSEVIGSTRKIYRQKGTGRARHGALKAPIFVGGGVAHGPQKYDHSQTINKKQRRIALHYALTLRLNNKDIRFIRGFNAIAPKTKEMVLTLQKLDALDKRTLLLYPDKDFKNLILASRNLKNIILRNITTLNAYDVLEAKQILFATEALEVLKKTPNGQS